MWDLLFLILSINKFTTSGQSYLQVHKLHFWRRTIVQLLKIVLQCLRPVILIVHKHLQD